jgi:hypothetical protein
MRGFNSLSAVGECAKSVYAHSPTVLNDLAHKEKAHSEIKRIRRRLTVNLCAYGEDTEFPELY